MLSPIITISCISLDPSLCATNRIHIPSSRIRLQELGQAHFLYQFHIYIIYCCKLSEAMIGPKIFPSKIKKKNCKKFVPPPPSPFLKVEINGTCTKIGSYSKSLKKLQRWTQCFRGLGGWWVVSNVIFYWLPALVTIFYL